MHTFRFSFMYMYVYMSLCIHICLYIHIYIHIHTNAHIHIYIHTYTNTHICTYIHTHAHIYIYIYICIHIHICYLHTQICNIHTQICIEGRTFVMRFLQINQFWNWPGLFFATQKGSSKQRFVMIIGINWISLDAIQSDLPSDILLRPLVSGGGGLPHTPEPGLSFLL